MWVAHCVRIGSLVVAAKHNGAINKEIAKIDFTHFRKIYVEKDCRSDLWRISYCHF